METECRGRCRPRIGWSYAKQLMVPRSKLLEPGSMLFESPWAGFSKRRPGPKPGAPPVPSAKSDPDERTSGPAACIRTENSPRRNRADRPAPDAAAGRLATPRRARPGRGSGRLGVYVHAKSICLSAALTGASCLRSIVGIRRDLCAGQPAVMATAWKMSDGSNYSPSVIGKPIGSLSAGRVRT